MKNFCFSDRIGGGIICDMVIKEKNQFLERR